MCGMFIDIHNFTLYVSMCLLLSLHLEDSLILSCFCVILQGGQRVTDIYEDFKDGTKLLLLLELLTGEKLVNSGGVVGVV